MNDENQSAEFYREYDLDKARVKDELIDVLSRAHSASINNILLTQNLDTIKDLCRAFDVNVTNRKKAELIEELTGIQVEET